jgi:aconitate hydratase
VVGKFVEFYGSGVSAVPLANRATIGNMSPEFGSTCAIFPIDEETLRYLEFTGRPPDLVALVEAYAKEQGLYHSASLEPRYSETLELDLSTVVPSLAGPSRPQDRVPLRVAKQTYVAHHKKMADERAQMAHAHVPRVSEGDRHRASSAFSASASLSRARRMTSVLWIRSPEAVTAPIASSRCHGTPTLRTTSRSSSPLMTSATAAATTTPPRGNPSTRGGVPG